MKDTSGGQNPTGGVFMKSIVMTAVCGAAAGAVNGLLGAGGGMILVPLLVSLTDIQESAVFSTSVSIILPICIVSLLLTWNNAAIDWDVTSLYLIGSTVGGFLAGKIGQKIPVLWLHRFLGILIIWGGSRYLC